MYIIVIMYRIMIYAFFCKSSIFALTRATSISCLVSFISVLAEYLLKNCMISSGHFFLWSLVHLKRVPEHL